MKNTMSSDSSGIDSSKISVLVVDDSLVFRRFLRDIFEDCKDVFIIGEAKNGIEALDFVLKTNPDVILLDVEMPLMDGMTALQHLMIHRPIPTIMFSSLTDEGTARCFDTLKIGAVDFVCKDFIFQEKKSQAHRELVIEKIRKAALVKIQSREPVVTFSEPPVPPQETEQRVVFCEECGHREMIAFGKSHISESTTCSNCGDAIELPFNLPYIQNSFVTVVGGGEGCFSNLLEIIPRLDPKMGGAVIVVIHRTVQHVNAFSEYLDAISSMKVLRAQEGVNIEGGNCYLASDSDYMCLKSHDGRVTLQVLQKNIPDTGPLDVLMASASAIYKKKAAGVILSGAELDGEKGMNVLLRNEGTALILEPDSCLQKTMGQKIVQQCNLHSTLNLNGLVEEIKNLHHGAKNDIID